MFSWQMGCYAQKNKLVELSGNWIGGSIYIDLQSQSNDSLPSNYPKKDRVTFVPEYLVVKSSFNDMVNIKNFSAVANSRTFYPSEAYSFEPGSSELCYYDDNLNAHLSVDSVGKRYIWAYDGRKYSKVLLEIGDSINLSTLKGKYNTRDNYEILDKEKILLSNSVFKDKMISSSFYDLENIRLFNPDTYEHKVIWTMYLFSGRVPNLLPLKFHDKMKIFQDIFTGKSKDNYGLYKEAREFLQFLIRFEGKWAYVKYNELGNVIENGYAYGISSTLRVNLLYMPDKIKCHLKNKDDNDYSCVKTKNFAYASLERGPLLLVGPTITSIFINEKNNVVYKNAIGDGFQGVTKPRENFIDKLPSIYLVDNDNYKLEFSDDYTVLREYRKDGDRWVVFSEMKKLSE